MAFITTINGAVDFISTWRTHKSISPDVILTDAQIAQFVSEFQGKLLTPENFRAIDDSHVVSYEPNSRPIFYTNGVDGVDFWRVAATASKNGGGAISYISDTFCGKVLNNDDVKDVLYRLLAGDGQEAIGEKMAGKVLSGYEVSYTTDASGKVISAQVDWTNRINNNAVNGYNVLAFDDFTSRHIMLAAESGDLRPLIPNVQTFKVWFTTELPAYLESGGNASMWGMPKDKLVGIYQDLQKNGYSEYDARLVVNKF